ncbi:sensor histidine kinase [Pseudonocardia oroxyli]|uniref:histidine kinase n=1 Tax=Pseudonocardia oroxyli TaxID=366584 RepID=A0A1G7SXH9_PSEOR|nr:sensor histidine kinase [Pseudonocardia oroxyli]SDG27786.1 Histidine kinase-, DNA gyrase B-, and HSP90-like ATPase [Pseudonocardia oroxyli]
MTDHGRWLRPPTAIAGTAFVVVVALLTASIAVAATLRPAGMTPLGIDTVLFALRYLCLAAVGSLVVATAPRQRIGWLLLGMGATAGVVGACAEGGRQLYATVPDLGAVVYLVGDQFAKIALLLLGLLFLLFPTGRTETRTARAIGWALTGVVALAVLAELVGPGLVPDPVAGVAAPPNPLGTDWGRALAPVQGPIGFGLAVALLVAAAGTLVGRFRRADPEQRVRLKWFAVAAVLQTATTVIDAVLTGTSLDASGWPAVPVLAIYALAAFGMAAAIGIAILRHRLFDVDVILSRGLAYGTLALLIALGYIGAVSGSGLLAMGPVPAAAVVVVFTAFVGAVFLPLKSRLDRMAERLVFGTRAGPHEVLADFTAHLDGTEDHDELVPAMARLVAEGTASDGATLWLRPRPGTELQPSSWPPGAHVSNEAATRIAPIQHSGTELGHVCVHRRSGRPLDRTEARLMDGLALQSGLVLLNAGLQRELEGRLDELTASRQRLVVAQDDERRRIERDLHDGAQQILISLRIKAGMAPAAARKGPEELAALVHEMQAEIGEAVESLRGLARGIRPALLESEGLRAALTARARQTNVSIEVRCGTERFPRDLEAAIYFCCSEALQNIAKHAAAAHGSILVRRERGKVCFEVHDDGRGFTPDTVNAGNGLNNMRDRLDVLSGDLTVRSTLGGGTTIAGWLPLPAHPTSACDEPLARQS